MNASEETHLEIRPLADRPQCIPTLVGWFFSEWNRFDQRSPSEIDIQLRDNLRREAMPITFVAFRNDMLVGTVSLDVSDLPPFDYLSPWLASLYVAPDSRGTRVGRNLVEHVIGFARDLGIRTIYLWTAGPTGFYERFGWRTLQTAAYAGRAITVMQRFGAARALIR